MPHDRSHNPPSLAESVRRALADFRSDASSAAELDAQRAAWLARRLQTRARQLQTGAERRQQAELDRMIQSPEDRATLVEITDQSFRSRRASRSVDQLIHILDVQGIPRFFSPLERTLLAGFQTFGGYLPGVAMPLVKDKIEHETANVVLPAEDDLLRRHLALRREQGVRMNVNLLGEAMLGEREARQRLTAYLAALDRPEIEVVSVKISTIYSQISPLARRHTVGVLCDRLEPLYRAAAERPFVRRDGRAVGKFVYLDMEEYRDMALTAEAFMRTLDRPGLEDVAAGVALQAYLPDSFAVQRTLTEWARRRVAAGGSPVTIRLVKGANMEMERVEASLRGWPLATFDDKTAVDANYCRMLRYGLREENLAAVRIGVATHNLFTLAYAIVLAADGASPESVQFEMLEGMANHQRRALCESAGNVLLYAPACRHEDFTTAIGYLVRRLDENTGPDNFLRHAFQLDVDGETWRRLEQGFFAGLARMDSLEDRPRRTQDRAQQSDHFPQVTSHKSQVTTHDSQVTSHKSQVTTESPVALGPRQAAFANEPDSDWSLPQNGAWAEGVLTDWNNRCDARAADVPLAVAGDLIDDGRDVRTNEDPSRPGVAVARCCQANEADVERAVAAAVADPAGWRRQSAGQRAAVLRSVADVLAHRRGELLGAMLAETGKSLGEGDPEVSEAIDFCRFYAESAEEWQDLAARTPGVAAAGRGVVAVVSPWNFPLAIPCGGVAAALAAGNTVLLKPASDATLVAWRLCECFWDAGVPRSALQFVPCSGATVGARLVADDRVDAVILTGGTQTALDMLRRKPRMTLLAETGGKNATIVTALADRDLAVKNVLHSAFSHGGQKCSATSLLILEDEVYRDERFRETLCDAAESLRVGSAWDLSTKIGPLIRPPGGALHRGLTTLDAGESWALAPRLAIDGNARLTSPAIKWGVRPGSFSHTTELFGPVLSVMHARDLREAIDLANATGYGLTAGLETLDDREKGVWQASIRAGNLYINRPTTGAIVLRQPFGGCGKSALGPGVKAGGPNYVAALMRFTSNSVPSAPLPPSAGVFASPEPRPDLAFPEPSLTLPHESLAERRQHLHQLRDGLRGAEGDNSVADKSPFSSAELSHLLAALESYFAAAVEEFDGVHDRFRLLGEDNFRRYLPTTKLRIRVAAGDTPWSVAARIAAARAAGCRTVVSLPPDLPETLRRTVELLDRLTDGWAGAIEFLAESDDELAEAVRAGGVGRLRYGSPAAAPDSVRRAAAERFVFIAEAAPTPLGRYELLWYCQEQSLSHAYHRYGNLGRRGR
jgi:RHH-type proline utilization regulon transcriptional repressor/proline dehydrogenase/delta 1-pyrroline-5-carboxylate dehydrogenase